MYLKPAGQDLVTTIEDISGLPFDCPLGVVGFEVVPVRDNVSRSPALEIHKWRVSHPGGLCSPREINGYYGRL